MDIVKSTVEKIIITNADMPNGCGVLDPIAVIAEDQGPGAGKITITCFGEAWTHYWSHMGETTKLMPFFVKASDDYLVGKLKTGIDAEVQDLDPERMEAALKREIVLQRRDGDLDRRRARELWNDAERVHEGDYADIFSDVFGDDWWYSLPHSPNPDYLYLTNIVKAVKAAFRQIVTAPEAKP